MSKPERMQHVCDDCASVATMWKRHAEDLLAVLKEIAKGKGEFSRDPLTHASNTIDAMKALAAEAIAKSGLP